MTLSLVIPDYMTDLKAFFKNEPTLAPLHGGRVFFRSPEPNKTAYPYVRIYLINAVMPDPEVPELQVRLGIHTWGNNNSMYTAVRVLANNLMSVVWNIDCGRLVPAGQTYVHSASIVSDMDLPDPMSGWPRRAASTLWFLRMAGTADP